ncbi:acyl-CoA dehydrogenase family protein [Microbacterium sp. A84]|uniref:acyl-CoA dehydrogenase family protein n=1 Tax=Microbacterium sp. A84 TaxID=3450715 RepID=UPI003F41F84F
MEIRLSPEQEEFAKASSALCEQLAWKWNQGRGPDSRQHPLGDNDVWNDIAELGSLAVRADEESGGAGGSCMDVCVLVEQIGRHALPVPVIGAILATEQLRLRSAPAEIVEPIVAGEHRITAALTRDLSGFARSPEDAIAFEANGARSAVLLGSRALSIPLGESRPSADLTRCFAEPNGEPSALSIADTTDEIRQRELAFALTIISADLLGLMSSALDRAVAHAKEREQFGKPIGSFQAIKHLLAEAHVTVEASRSAVWYSAWAVDALDPDASLAAARTTKAFASVGAVEVIEATIQTLGGIGMTWESFAHVWQRRIQMDRRLFGDEFAQYAALSVQE